MLAILYGSFLELEEFRDIDIAVYISKYDLNTLFSIADRLEESLGYPVDVILLQEVPPRQRLRLLTRGLTQQLLGFCFFWFFYSLCILLLVDKLRLYEYQVLAFLIEV